MFIKSRNSRDRLRIGLLFFAVLAFLGASTGLAQAQEEEANSFQIHSADATGEKVELSYVAPSYESDITAEISNGADVFASETATAIGSKDVEIALVVDLDNRARTDELFTKIIEQLSAQVDSMPDGIEYSIYSAGSSADLVDTTSDKAEAKEILAAMTPEEGSSTVEAVTQAARSLGESDDAVRSIIVASTGSSTNGSEQSAVSALLQEGVQLFVVTVGEPDVALSSVQSNIGSGLFLQADINNLPTQMGAVFSSASDRYLVTFTSELASGTRQNIDVAIDGETRSVSYVAGVDLQSPSDLSPIAVTEGKTSIWANKIVLYVSMLLAFVGIAAGVWAVVSLLGNPDGELDGVLSSYVNPDGTVVTEEELLVQSSIIKKAVSATETFTEKRGFSEKVADLLERADLPIKTAEALFFGFAGTFVVFGLVFVVSRSLIGALVFGLTTAGIMFFVLQFLARRRLKKFEAQLPDTLQLLAGTLRAGYSLPQGMDAVSKEIDKPMGQELARAMSEAQLGRDLEDALAGVAERLDSPDFAWAVMAIAIQREVGGNLNELLMSVADTMTQRDRLKREVSALTAEGRVSAGLLSIMPPALAMVIWVINPEYLDPLFSGWLGRGLLGLGITSALIGLVWMKKVVTIDA